MKILSAAFCFNTQKFSLIALNIETLFLHHTTRKLAKPRKIESKTVSQFKIENP
jgi:hypothetical protein